MAKTNAQRQTAWRNRQQEKKAWKKQTLARWAEHNMLHVTKQEDGGFLIGIEQSSEGENVTAELAELCGMDPDTFLQTMIGEVLAQEGGEFRPVKRERGS